MIQRVLYDNCPLCETTDLSMDATYDCSSHPAYSINLPSFMTWLTCDSCGHNFTDGYFDEDGFSEIGRVAHPNQVFSIRDYEKNRFITGKIISRVSDVLGHSRGKWLDVGFGNGGLLLTAKEFGFQVTGLEFRKEAITALSPYVFDLRNEDFLEMPESDKFHVISMADVLEHVSFPKVYIEKSHHLLQDNGLLFISMPNRGAPIWSILNQQNSNPYWNEIEHFHNFSREGLVEVMEKFDFEMVHYGMSERYRACMELIFKKL